MIRIYLDWSIVSYLKTDEYAELNDFINEHMDKFLFPYSSAHFDDLMKSYSPENEKFYIDLDRLENLAGRHLLEWDGDNYAMPNITPKEYFSKRMNEKQFSSIDLLHRLIEDSNKDDLSLLNFGKILKLIYSRIPSGITVNEENSEALKILFPGITNESSQWDLMESVIPFVQKIESENLFYKNFRKQIGDKGLKLPETSADWKAEDVFQNIDSFFKTMDAEMTFKKYVEITVSNLKTEAATIYDFFTTAYMLLDMIGYKQDKLPKPTDTVKNIRTDVEHAFYAASCDYFVVADKFLTQKTKVLYKEFDISTKVISPKSMIEELKTTIHYADKKEHLITEAFGLVKSGTLIETIDKDEAQDIDYNILIYKLSVFHFNFFTHADYVDSSEDDVVCIEFYRPYSKYYSFVFYNELENLFDRIMSYFGSEHIEDLKNRKKEFVYNADKHIFRWQYNFGIVQFQRDDITNQPRLLYAIKSNLH